jgi:hypothetical protein
MNKVIKWFPIKHLANKKFKELKNLPRRTHAPDMA